METLIKTKPCIQRLKFTLIKHPSCNSGQCCYHIETSLEIYGWLNEWETYEWDGFFTMATVDWNKPLLTTAFSLYYFLFSWRNSSHLSKSKQPNQTYFSQLKSIKPRMLTEYLASNNYKQFNILLNTNEIQLYNYPDLPKKSFT